MVKKYAELKKVNPLFPILVREAEGAEAKLIARFGEGLGCCLDAWVGVHWDRGQYSWRVWLRPRCGCGDGLGAAQAAGDVPLCGLTRHPRVRPLPQRPAADRPPTCRVRR